MEILSQASFWRERGFTYTDQEAKTTPQVLVRLGSPARGPVYSYPADKVGTRIRLLLFALVRLLSTLLCLAFGCPSEYQTCSREVLYAAVSEDSSPPSMELRPRPPSVDVTAFVASQQNCFCAISRQEGVPLRYS